MNDRNKLTDRLRIQAELCLKMASYCWDERRAQQLRLLARDCLEGPERGNETLATVRVRRKPTAR